MFSFIKNTWLGLTLILLASALLLLSDLKHRNPAEKRTAEVRLPRIAIMQWTSTPLIDDSVTGIVEGLKQQGFEQKKTADIHFFNSSGDTATANVMAREMASGNYDIAITASTLSLQAMANANQAGRVVHVFGCVTDPYGAGVGITGTEPSQHPRHLVGIGTFQPVDRVIETARQMNPQLKRIGVVWNTAESNSEACVLVARKTCAALGIELIEANASNTSEVPEAARSIVSRDAEAIWVGGDTVANSSITTIVSVARTAKIPVFSNDPNDVDKGALFSIGASYPDVGIVVGTMAAKILNGADPASFGIKNVAPELLKINETLASTYAGWSISNELRKQTMAASGPSVATLSQPEPNRMYRVGILYFGAHPIFEKAITGIEEALTKLGFVEGKNLTLIKVHPNNDMSLLPQVAQSLFAQEPDLIIPLSTPCLGATLAQKKAIPLVFGIVSAPIEAGAGKSFEDHLPNVTGAVWSAPNPELFKWLKKCYPNCEKVGVIYNPSEANSNREKERARKLLAAEGMTLVERTINTSADVAQAIQSLLTEDVDAVFGMADNTLVSSFPALAQACKKAHIPLLADDNSLMGTGALFTCGSSPEGEGLNTGRLAARVLLGEKPADIPFAAGTETETAVDLSAAANLGISLPEALIQKAVYTYPISQAERPTDPWEIRIIRYNNAQFSLDSYNGILEGFKQQGLQEGRDYTIKCLNAQGEMATLSSIMTTFRADQPDLIMTISTPALQAALRQAGDLPIVFSSVADGVKAGGGESETNHLPNVTGITTRSPFAEMARLIKASVPNVRAVGTLYSPAEINSELYRQGLEEALRNEGLTLIAVPATSTAEISESMTALLRTEIQLVCQIADNLTRPAYPQIIKKAADAGLAFFCFDSAGMKDGATLALARDYYDAGIEAAAVGIRVLKGEAIKDIPFTNTKSQKLVSNPELIQQFGIRLPPSYTK
jgi:ABC-type uncharacterized transport system substrate-binding protein